MIFVNVYHRSALKAPDLRLFIGLLLTDALLLISDTLLWVLDGLPGLGVGVVLNLAATLYYILTPVICLIWFFYIEYYIHEETAQLKKKLLPMFIPAGINAVFSVLSLSWKYIFYIDSDNIYHRGTALNLFIIIPLFYIVATTVIMIRYRKRIKKQDVIPIYFFMFPPVVGAFFQIVFYGLSIIWPLATLAILIVFIRLQNKQLFTDHLTGLSNRRQIDRFLRSNLQSAESGIMGGLMIDVDSFKNINDVYGHSAGDQALVDTSDILRKTFRKNDFIARYGGDEFIVVIKIASKNDLSTSVERLHENVRQFNERKTAPYMLSLSIGYDFYINQTTNNIQDFLKHLDDLMYKNKHINEARRVPVNQ